MELSNFYAGRGSAPLYQSEGQFTPVSLEVVELGELPIPSGEVGASDPFVIMDGFPRFAVPADRGRLQVTVADVSAAQDGSHRREAYLSLLFSAARPAAVLPAIPIGEREELAEGNFYGVPVDAGTVSFFDAASMADFLRANSGEELQELTEEWIDLLWDESEHRSGLGLTHYETASGKHLIPLVQSGWGDGFYPVLKTVDAQGNLLGLHIDLEVVGK